MTLKIIPLGGLGEIGLNMMMFEYGETMFVVDAGLMFPEDYMLGVDYGIPDMSYIKKQSAKISGIILTHAHEDHIGALPYLLREVDAPVFGTPLPSALSSTNWKNTISYHPAVSMRSGRENNSRSENSSSILSASATVSWMVSGWPSTPPWVASFIPGILRSATPPLRECLPTPTPLRDMELTGF